MHVLFIIIIIDIIYEMKFHILSYIKKYKYIEYIILNIFILINTYIYIFHVKC